MCHICTIINISLLSQKIIILAKLLCKQMNSNEVHYTLKFNMPKFGQFQFLLKNSKFHRTFYICISKQYQCPSNYIEQPPNNFVCYFVYIWTTSVPTLVQRNLPNQLYEIKLFDLIYRYIR